MYFAMMIGVHSRVRVTNCTTSRILRSSMQSLLLKSYRPNTLYYGERSFAFAAPKLWNSIPEHIKSASSLTTFKTALKTYLFRRHFRDE